METQEPSRAGGALERPLFVAATLASAFLIFLVQPMVGKRILPWFGGAPAVWSLCLAFYQTALFCGYAYAHGLVRFASPGAQVAIHATLVAAACAVLPVLPGDAWRPGGVDAPIRDILVLLLVHVALPFVALAATGPLVQAWWARRYTDRSPYPLYAVSNAGSLFAVFAYPFILEPELSLSATGAGWSIAFVLTGASIVGCATLAWRTHGLAAAPFARPAPAAQRIGAGRVAAWLLLPGVAVVVLMGVTNKVTLDVASVPFLWVLPLGTYLLTFIFAFASERNYRRPAFVVFTAAAFAVTAGVPLWRDWVELDPGGAFLSLAVQIPGYCALLFGVGMVLHGELFRLRPEADRLTTFYLCVAGGGALGGIAVGIGAPVVFDDYYELPLGLALAAALLLSVCASDPTSSLYHARPSRWRWAVIALAAVLLIVHGTTAQVSEGLIHRERSFFGVLRVSDSKNRDTTFRRLTSGLTVHGIQVVDQRWSSIPTAYFGRGTPIGLWMTGRRSAAPRRVGIAGLGIGTLATYGLADETFRFYEIDPIVVRIARDDGLFSYLRDSLADIDVVLGDARLSLVDEQKRGEEQRFDVLVIDAFNSDAIPVHLLTREAFEVYAAALAPDGMLAVHVSNRHFNLMPLVARQGFEVGLSSLVVESADALSIQSRRSRWVLLMREEAALRDAEALLRKRAHAMGLPASHLILERPTPADVAWLSVWTDDYSDLISTLRPK